MNKKSILYILLDLIFLAVFNTVFFVVGGSEHPVSVWVSYGFIHFSYLMILATPFLVRKSSSAAVFGYSLYFVSAVYFFIEFIAGLIFIFVGSESYKLSLAVQIIIAGIYAVMLISNLIANEYTADGVERHEDEVAYIKNVASRVKMLVGKINDKKTDKEIEKVYDLLHSSPTKTIVAVYSLEMEIINKVTLLENAVMAKDSVSAITLASEIVTLVEQRNKKIRLSN